MPTSSTRFSEALRLATATTAVHATSQNVTDIQLCIAALAGFPLRTVVPIGGYTYACSTQTNYAS